MFLFLIFPLTSLPVPLVRLAISISGVVVLERPGRLLISLGPTSFLRRVTFSSLLTLGLYF